MDNLFDACVELLIWLSNIFGLSYKEINIWIFVIIEPIIFVFMFVWILKLKEKRIILVFRYFYKNTLIKEIIINPEDFN